MNLTSHQRLAVIDIIQWLNNKIDPKPYYVLGGLAGTGKTTIIREVVNGLTGAIKVNIVAPTGKAAQVLTNKGIKATSVHRLVYEVVSLYPLKFERTDKVNCDVIICDEASMVNKEMFDDIMSFKKKVLFVGDYGQLPPIGGDPKIMSKMDFVLTEIMRQDEGSDIIVLANQLRQCKDPNIRSAIKSLGESVNVNLAKPGSLRNVEFLREFDQVIVGRNATRHYINSIMKQNPVRPEVGDRIICMKNNYEFGLMNGEQAIIAGIEGELDDDGRELVTVLTEQGEHIKVPWWKPALDDTRLDLRDLPKGLVWFNYAYAITCHKAQGSEWDHVALLDESFGDFKSQWLYTGLTRAKKRFTLL